MMEDVNQRLNSAPLQDRSLREKCPDFFRDIGSGMTGGFGKLRKLASHTGDLRSFLEKQDDLRKDRLDSEMHDIREPWTLRTAFYATSGACVYRSKHTTGKAMTTIEVETLKLLASEEPGTLLPERIAASQNPGQSSGIVKIIACVQAAWFCSQCIARMSSGLAISPLELNTFAHCVSAFFIYGFWWHKPYDVTSHTFIQSEILDFLFLRNAAVKASQRPDDISGEPTV
jgi:hypothetical protein